MRFMSDLRVPASMAPLDILVVVGFFLLIIAWAYCLAFSCWWIVKPPQVMEVGEPSNLQQRVVQRPPPLPLPSQQVLGTVITYKNHGTGETYADCAICLEKFEDGNRCRIFFNCKHMYHKFCIDQWLARHRRCPLCRDSLRGSRSR